MSYDMHALGAQLMWRNNAYLTGANLAATAADWAELHCHIPVQVKRITFGVKTAVTAGNVAPTVTVYQRPTSGSNSSQVLLGTLTIPNGTAAGSIVYKDLESVRIKAGQGLAFRVNTQATDNGTAAGVGFPGALILLDPEYPVNQALMVASS